MNDRTRTLCRRLNARVRQVAPVGLGRWDGAWSMVNAPSDRFLQCLSEWEAEDIDRTRARVNEAATALVDAWRRAGEAWEAAGKPGAREEVPA